MPHRPLWTWRTVDARVHIDRYEHVERSVWDDFFNAFARLWLWLILLYTFLVLLLNYFTPNLFLYWITLQCRKSVTETLYIGVSSAKLQHRIHICKLSFRKCLFWLYSNLLSCYFSIALPLLFWSHHSIAHVWTFIIIKINNVVNDLSCILQVLWPFHPIQPFLLYNGPNGVSTHSGQCLWYVL